jgi:YHS domain-containing protein
MRAKAAAAAKASAYNARSESTGARFWILDILQARRNTDGCSWLRASIAAAGSLRITRGQIREGCFGGGRCDERPGLRSTIDPGRAVARTEHAGRLYYFCFSACERAFAGDPQRYAERRRCSPTAPSRTARRRALTISRSRSRSASPSRAAGRATAAERGRAKGPPAPERTTRLDRHRERLSARAVINAAWGAGRNGSIVRASGACCRSRFRRRRSAVCGARQMRFETPFRTRVFDAGQRVARDAAGHHLALGFIRGGPRYANLDRAIGEVDLLADAQRGEHLGAAHRQNRRGTGLRRENDLRAVPSTIVRLRTPPTRDDLESSGACRPGCRQARGHGQE